MNKAGSTKKIDPARNACASDRAGFAAIRVARKTTETDFAIVLAPRRAESSPIDIPNRLLSHFLDHFSKSAGINFTLDQATWPRSWEFDHVLCEDLGQLVGRGVAAIATERAAQTGIAGRASARSTMDDAASGIAIALEDRPRCQWLVEASQDIDGFVDSWFGSDGHPAGESRGTNLRQFLDGFAYGSGATVTIDIQLAGNLHHLYETIFRNLGDAVGRALGTQHRLPGESSGLAGSPTYVVKKVAGK